MCIAYRFLAPSEAHYHSQRWFINIARKKILLEWMFEKAWLGLDTILLKYIAWILLDKLVIVDLDQMGRWYGSETSQAWLLL